MDGLSLPNGPFGQLSGQRIHGATDSELPARCACFAPVSPTQRLKIVLLGLSWMMFEHPIMAYCVTSGQPSTLMAVERGQPWTAPHTSSSVIPALSRYWISSRVDIDAHTWPPTVGCMLHNESFLSVGSVPSDYRANCHRILKHPEMSNSFNNLRCSPIGGPHNSG